MVWKLIREREMEGSKQPANGEVVMSLMACLSGFWAGLGPRGISRKMANQKVSEVTRQSISSLPSARKIDGGRGGDGSPGLMGKAAEMSC